MVNLAFTRVLSIAMTICLIVFKDTSAFNLTVLHTNDCHTRFVETDVSGRVCTAALREAGECYGGVARRATVVNRIRSRDPGENVLLLDAGDQFQGTDWFVVYRGNATAYFMNILEYDAMCLGNHEFDNGISGLLPFLKNVSFPILSCNIDASSEPRLQGLFVCSHVFEFSGERVGVVGYTLQSTPDFAKTEQLTFGEEIAAVQSAVDGLQALGINKVIALGHVGFAMDEEVAASVPGIDLVIGGHSNTFLYTGDAPSNQEPIGPYPFIVHPTYDTSLSIPVVTAYAYGKYLGYLQLEFDDNGVVTRYSGNPILLDNSTAPDPYVQSEVDAWQIRVDEVSTAVIGHTLTPLEGSLQICGTQECNLGNMMADAMLLSNGMEWNDAGIAITTSGSIASSIDQGNITTGDLILVMPYGNTIDLVQLYGSHLLQLLEVPMMSFEPSRPTYGFLQVSGMKIEYDLTREDGDRVYRAQVQCQDCVGDGSEEFVDVDPDELYYVIMNSYMAGGGGGFEVVRDNKVQHISGINDVDVTSSYIQAMSPLNVTVEGRTIIYDQDYRPGAGHIVKPYVALVLSLALMMLIRLL
ncbi:5'-nucleotidase-like [Diadema antillarum]|uniref:5'-nucleotidase-like n=1 Tax=Diadema antillarum TaxID=105358 RepID=UPI003A8C12A9